MLTLTVREITLLRATLLLRLSKLEADEDLVAIEIKFLLQKLWRMRRDLRLTPASPD